ncbi:MAG TPA: autoinducer binding domain-containing protein [Ideonella sp.]|uniref:helix-turn-helix transcriptional regulator n=1 Tax=Ideonella sp. TaxID=1929293 RepID=UPI002E37F914|nr:autoinducer binding domain-containing protein [Ideonella sp.]HEX5682771.1 autoinducer binding domain-containing protein [Ideonella sp.]
MMFDQEIAEGFNRAEDERTLRGLMQEIAYRVGANCFQALRFTSTEHGWAANEMSGYATGLFEAYDAAAPANWRDPVVEHERCSSTPIVWNRDTYEQLGSEGRLVYEVFGDFNIGFGVGIGVHLDPKRHFTLDLTWPHHRKPDAQLPIAIQLYAFHAEAAFHRVWTAVERQQLAALLPERTLTERELQTLFLASRGFRIPDMAAHLCRSKRTFEKHAQALMEKLNASTLAEAVSIAERLDLFAPLRSPKRDR